MSLAKLLFGFVCTLENSEMVTNVRFVAVMENRPATCTPVSAGLDIISDILGLL